jgi:hypothetical protein
MNTRKTVYNKLFKEEVNLDSHEVQLGKLQDLEGLFENYSKQDVKFQKLILEIAGFIGQMQKEFTVLNSYDSKIDPLFKELSKYYDILGVEMPMNLSKYYTAYLNSKKFNSDSFIKYKK